MIQAVFVSNLPATISQLGVINKPTVRVSLQKHPTEPLSAYLIVGIEAGGHPVGGTTALFQRHKINTHFDAVKQAFRELFGEEMGIEGTDGWATIRGITNVVNFMERGLGD